MFCTKCGAELPDDAVFCSRCGVKIVIPERVSGTVERTQTAPGREAAVVYGEEEFRTAVTERRETIIIRGEIAGKLAEKVRNSSTGNLVSNVAIVAGLIFFWPALVGGIAGKLVTRELKNYEIQSASADEVVLIRKEKLL